MKSIATVNFKGGVGKTTITWLLAKYAAEVEKKRILVVDTDAQMSLTMAVQLDEQTGTLVNQFQQWYDATHRARNKTILHALEAYDRMEGRFDFPIDGAFIYPMSDTLHFVPSVPDLYWLELDVFDREKVKHFIRALMGKIEHSRRYEYDYIFYDCPPQLHSLVLLSTELLQSPLDSGQSRCLRATRREFDVRWLAIPDRALAKPSNRHLHEQGEILSEGPHAGNATVLGPDQRRGRGQGGR